MRTQVLLFAGLKQAFGRESIPVDLPAAATVGQLVAALVQARPDLAGPLRAARVAVDEHFAEAGDPIPPGAEVALIPPVSGGHDHVRPVILSRQPLSLDAVVTAVQHESAGGIATFSGVVRRQSRGKTVHHLEYEAYDGMAVKALAAIVRDLETQSPGVRVAIHHRVGELSVGELAVVIAASAPHRGEALDACRVAIERLKQDVPIWKKEVSEDGEEWIGLGP